MGTDKFKSLVQSILAPAGITVNGNDPWDIRIKDERFYRRAITEGSLGLGESYVDGWWECERLDEFFFRIIPLDPEAEIRKDIGLLLRFLPALVLNKGGRARAFQIGEKHYDRGNRLFRHMLDRRMVYSCAYWKDAKDLDEAQEAKLDLICRKLSLRPGQRVMDIGCGWGGLAKYAAEKYGVSATGITVSREQAELGKLRCEKLPVEIRLQDYREVDEEFDHIASVGMFEHVGYKNYRTYLQAVHRCLKDEGLFLLHTIGSNRSQIAGDPWIDKYIFPNSLVPSMKQISASLEGLFVVEDWHNFGPYYDPTLLAWFRNFDAHWDELRELYSDRFYRMWKYYLLSCSGSFRCRHMQVWQFVLSKRGVPGGYRPVR
ncbi:MAG TPA: cyclopropane fatty acyl phospholipid synthase [Dissulfurispiraceae bacterium]